MNIAIDYGGRQGKPHIAIVEGIDEPIEFYEVEELFEEIASKLEGSITVQDEFKLKDNPSSLATPEEDSKKSKGESNQFNKNFNFFLESSVSKHGFAYLLAEKGQVYVIDGIVVKEYREKENIKKTDLNDAQIIFKLSKERPDLFRPLKIEDLRLKFLAKKLSNITKDIVRLEHRILAYKREFGMTDKNTEEFLKIKEREKYQVLKELEPLVKDIVERINLPEFGPICVAMMLAHNVNPEEVPSLSKFKAMLQLIDATRYKDPKKGYSKDNILKMRSLLKGVLFNFAKNSIKEKYPLRRQLYEKFKQDLAKNKGSTGMQLHMQALNRLLTMLMKIVYYRWRNQPIPPNVTTYGLENEGFQNRLEGLLISSKSNRSANLPIYGKSSEESRIRDEQFMFSYNSSEEVESLLTFGKSNNKRNSSPNKSGQSLFTSSKNFEKEHNSAHSYTLDRWLKEE
ncbi:MAG: transposase [Ignisphaera sp.]